MAEGFSGIIAELERQKSAIDRALAASRDVDVASTPSQIWYVIPL